MILDEGQVAIHAKIKPVDISFLLFGRKVKPGIPIFKKLFTIRRPGRYGTR